MSHTETEAIEEQHDSIFVFPASPAQQGLWLIDRLENGSPRYNINNAFEIRGEFYIDDFNSAWQASVDKHEILRTALIDNEGQLQQAVFPALTLSINEVSISHPLAKNSSTVDSSLNIPEFKHLNLIDLSDRPDKEGLKYAQNIFKQQSLSSFDLSSPGIFRLSILKLSPQRHIFLSSFHHTIVDGWSLKLLFEELCFDYTAISNARKSDKQEAKLAQAPVFQYADFAVWLEEQENEQGVLAIREKETLYWQKQLEAVPALSLPTDFHRPAKQTTNGDIVTFEIGSELSSSLSTLAAKNSCTIVNLLFTTFSALLHNYSQQSDFAIGLPVARRESEELQNLIGLMVNTVAIRCKTNKSTSFIDAMHESKRAIDGALEHQALAFENVVDSLSLERDLGITPVFQTMFSCFSGNKSYSLNAQQNCTLSLLDWHSPLSQFDMSLECYIHESGTSIHFVYNSDIFAHTSIERMGQQFIHMLNTISTNPEVSIKALLTPSAPTIIHGKAIDLKHDDNVIKRFKAQVALLSCETDKQKANDIALRYGSQSLSYQELDHLSDQFAVELAENGLGKQDVIALFLPRSLELFVTLLAISKLGACYLPININSPRKRLIYQLQHANISGIVADPSVTAPILNELSKVNKSDKPLSEVCLLNPDLPSLKASQKPPVDTRIDKSDCAYLIYTSGSTGNSKAVQISHGALINHCSWMDSDLPLNAEDIVLQRTPIFFDASVWEIWQTFISGAQLVLLDDTKNGDVAHISEILQSHNITHVQFVPALLTSIVKHINSTENRSNRDKPVLFPKLKRVYSGGDSLAKKLQAETFHCFPNIELINLYGPTETCIDASFERFHSPALRHYPSLGSPIANTHFVLLDENRDSVMPGCPAELYIGGEGLATGYINAAQKEQDLFISSEQSPNGSRLFRSGDMVRLDSNNELIYLGRRDHQIKLNGVRIELGEIENCTLQHEGVKQAICRLQKKQTQNQHLRLFLVLSEQNENTLDSSGQIDEDLILSFLSEHMPHYMLPSEIIFLDTIPLLPNGKIDNQALYEHESAKALCEPAQLSPRHHTDERLIEIWTEVLRDNKSLSDAINIQSNFFLVGGHSLLAIKVINQINQSFCINLLVEDIFHSPRLAKLADLIIQKQSLGAKHQTLPRLDRNRLYEASDIQQRIWFLMQLPKGSEAYNLSAAYRIQGDIDLASLRKAFSLVQQQQEALRSRFDMLDNKLNIEVMPQAQLQWQTVDLSQVDEPQRQRKIQEQLKQLSEYSFDTTIPGLYKIRIIRETAQSHIFAIVLSHIIADGWSIDVLMRSLQEAYISLCNTDKTNTFQLPTLAHQQIDFIHWSRQSQSTTQDTEKASAAVEYWKDLLSKLTAIDLITDYTTPEEPNFDGNALRVTLNSSLTKKLLSYCHETQSSTFTVLMSAFQLLLARYNQANDFSIAYPVANRDHQDIQDVMGCFVNTLIMPTHINHQGSFNELNEAVQANMLSSHKFQRSFSPRLIKSINSQQSASIKQSATPLSPVMFNFQEGNEPTAISGLEISEYPIPIRTSQFDLSLHCNLEKNNTITLLFNYRTALYRHSTIERLSVLFENTLRSAISHPDQALSSLPWQIAKEEQLIQQWNDTQRQSDAPDQLHLLIDKQCQQTPHNIALRYENEQLSYEQLNKRANKLSALINNTRVSNSDNDFVVGICCQRSTELVSGLLGILKSGAAYLPIDPDLPDQRLQYMLKQSKVDILLSQEKYLERCNTLTSVPIINLNNPDFEDKDIVSSDHEEAPYAATTEKSLAYIIYTSGSTGQPKGVMVPHDAICNRLLWMQSHYDIKASDKILQKTPYTFDVSVWEFFLPLISGATLVLAKPDGHKDPFYLHTLIQEQAITCLHFVPSMLDTFLQNVKIEECDSLQKVFCSGEALSIDIVDRFRTRARNIGLHNLYGPTEAAVDVSYQDCNPVSRVVPIGKPIWNTQLIIVDDQYNHQPIGVVGELLIGGVGLARGYIAQPKLTDERFILLDQKRWFKTGDLARWNEQGEIEYLGRSDQQIKLRGFRIEPGEIESHLRQHPKVSQAAVVLDKQGSPRLVAYLVLHQPQDIDSKSRTQIMTQLLSELKKQLPEYMVPTVIHCIDELPLTTNGKLNVKQLIEKAAELTSLPQTPLDERKEKKVTTTSNSPSQINILNKVKAIWEDVLKRSISDYDSNFFEIGGDSLLLVAVTKQLKDQGYSVSITDLFKHTSLRSISEFLADSPINDISLKPTDIQSQSTPQDTDEIAIIGMAGRFPDAHNIEQFWQNLCEGKESIKTFGQEEMASSGVSEENYLSDSYVPRAAILDNIEDFDAEYFGFNPAEAAALDPQQRIFLECVDTALTDAGYDSMRSHHKIGLFAGTSINTYALHYQGEIRDADIQTLISNDKDFLCTRASYKLGLRGPAMTVQTACSTSLTAVHQAISSLRQNDCDMAIAGGVCVTVPQHEGYHYTKDSIRSPDGHVRAFDKNAAGMVGGSGCGIVVLKPMKKALADGDNIYAKITGIALNNDGHNKVGYTAPSEQGQTEVIQTALAKAKLTPGSIGYIECHGTATPLGDMIEVSALKNIFQSKNPIALGSVKTNIGHLDAAAGIAGLIKASLCVYHGKLVPSLNYEQANPQLGLDDSPFFVNTQLKQWQRSVRRAGVSSFGIGGTNVHAIVENIEREGTATEITDTELTPGISDEAALFVLSAKNNSALDQMQENLTQFINNNPHVSINNAAYTTQVGRREFDNRRVLIAKRNLDNTQNISIIHQESRSLTHARQSALVIPGQGSQRVGMARRWYLEGSIFANTLDYCLSLLQEEQRLLLRELLLSAQEPSDSQTQQLQQTAYAQPALFIFQYALIKQMQSYGIHVQAIIGHSLGEWVAACLAGVMTLEDAVYLVTKRGELMQAMAPGQMLSLSCSAEQANILCENAFGNDNNTCNIAAINSQALCVVSGDEKNIAALEQYLLVHSPNIAHKRLITSHAFHSEMMAKASEQLLPYIKNIALTPPTTPFISNIGGDWISDEEACNAEYWASQLRKTVQFHAGITTLKSSGINSFIEVGPGNAFRSILSTGNIKKTREKTQLEISYTSLWPTQNDLNLLNGKDSHCFHLHLLARLWLQGLQPDWKQLPTSGKRQRVSLPSYPYARKSYWIEDTRKNKELSKATQFYCPQWHRTASHDNKASSERFPQASLEKTCIISEKHSLSAFLQNKLVPGETVCHSSKKPNNDILKERFSEHPGRYELIVYIAPAKVDTQRQCQELCHYINTINALSSENKVHTLIVISHSAQSVFGIEDIDPGSEVLATAVKVANQEIDPNCYLFDVDDSPESQQSLLHILYKFEDGSINNHAPTERINALRFGQLWTQRYQPAERAEAPSSAKASTSIREHGKYIITGGLGQVGLAIGGLLKKHYRADVILTGRSPLTPSKEEALRKAGLEVQNYRQSDVCNLQQCKELLSELSPVNGIIHAAGLTGTSAILPISEYEQTRANTIFQAKDLGTRNLNAVLLEHPQLCSQLDFILACSSIAVDLGGRGFMTYAIANHHMESLIRQFQKESTLPWQCLRWDGWQNTSYERGFNDLSGFLAFKEAIQYPYSPITAATDELNSRYTSHVQTKVSNSAQTPLRPLPRTSETSRENSDYIPAETQTEKRLAHYWQSLLGYNKVSLDDDFFLLGGHSLLATQLLKSIETELDVQLPLVTLLENSSLQKMAAAIDAAKGENYQDHEKSLSHKEEIQDLIHPMSYAQQRIWFHQQYTPLDTSYHIPCLLKITGALNLACLKQALEYLFSQHDILNARFINRKGKPEIHYANKNEVSIQEHHVNTEQEALDYLQEIAELPFDLEVDQLVRIQIVKLDTNTHYLSLTIHHIISDGWSIGVLLKNISQYYQALLANKSLPTEKPSYQYKDFVKWQENILRDEKLCQFWQGQLDGAPEKIELPLDFPRPKVQGYKGKTISTPIPGELNQALSSIAREFQVTEFMVYLSAFYVLLFRYSEQDLSIDSGSINKDIVIGTPVAGRDNAHFNEVCGPLINTLPLRSNISADLSFSDLLKQVRKVTSDALCHQQLPFEKILELCQVTRDPSRSPLYQVLFSFLNIPEPDMRMGDSKIESLALDSHIAKLDLSLAIEHKGNERAVAIEYNTDLFEEITIERMLDSYLAIISDIAKFPQKQIALLSLFSVEHYDSLLNQDTGPIVEKAAEESAGFISKFDHIANQYPDHTAIKFADTSLSYSALETQSKIVASWLQQQGVCHGDIVAWQLPRSESLPLIIIAIQRCGAAYLPLDEHLPAKRIKDLLDDSGAKFLLSQESDLDIAFSGKTLNFVNCPIFDGESSKALPPFTPVTLSTEDLAYIIYTSGTTGKPKGVAIPHGALANFIDTMQDRPGMTHEDIIYSATRYSFDMSCFEIFVPLASGASIVLGESGVLRNPEKLKQELTSSGATVFEATPSTWRLLLNSDWIDNKLTMLCGGEAMPADLARQLKQRGGALWNMYGPTESTVWASCLLIEDQEQTITLGQAVNNVEFVVLGPQQQVVPFGVSGELYIGGKQLAQGYINNPTLTGQSFIDIQFNNNAEIKRLYKTGDVVKRLANGELVYQNRIDQQVKLNGYRIELSEIENCLSQHRAVKEAIAVMTEQQQIHAFLILHHDISEESLRNCILDSLPSYMMPAVFYQLDTFPLNVNGKVDRKKILTLKPTPIRHLVEQKREVNSSDIESTATQQELESIWQSLLGHEAFDEYSNFFQVGGHSLLTVELQFRVNQKFNVDIPISDFFVADTLVKQSQLVEKSNDSTAQQDDIFIPLSKDDFDISEVKAPLYFIPGAAGNPHSYQPLAEAFTKEYPFIALAPPQTHQGKYENIVELATIYSKHIAEQQSKRNNNQEIYLGGHSFGALVAFETAFQLEKRGYSVKNLTILDLIHPEQQVPVPAPESDGIWLHNIACALASYKSLPVPDISPYEAQDYEQVKQYFLSYLKDTKMVSASATTSIVDSTLASYKLNNKLFKTYKSSYINADINIYVAETQSSEEATKVSKDYPLLGWDAFTQGRVKRIDVAGDHISMVSTENAPSLSGILYGEFLEA